MIIILLVNKFSSKTADEPSRIWYAAAIEMLVFDAPMLGILYSVIALG